MDIDRYHRQRLLPQIGPGGQDRLAGGRVLVVGCGALGSVIAEQLVRAGVGNVRIVDRDLVELTNLQRQVLFDEADVAGQRPKAVAAAERLGRINSQVRVEPRVVDVHAGNIEELAGLEPGGTPVDVMLDGTDNVETRYLLNDVAVKHSVPWVYGACVATEGRCLAIRPPHTPCLRCLFAEPPAAGELPTCDTAGVLGPASAIVACLQAVEAIRIILGNARELPGIDPTSRGPAGPNQLQIPTTADRSQGARLIAFDVWESRFRTLSMRDARDPGCLTCGRRNFEFLDRLSGGASTSLCGRRAVQVRPGTATTLDLDRLAGTLGRVGRVERTPYLLRCDLHEPADLQLTVFPDGRAIIQGTADPERARSIYARFIGA